MATREHQPPDQTTRRFLRQAMQAPLLSREEEIQLAGRWLDDGDEAALHELITAHIRLVAGAASRYRRLGLPLAELLQEGTVGLLQAANRFDPGREVRFSTYANWWVRAQMQDYLLRNWSVIRVGSSTLQKRLFARLRNASRGEANQGALSEAQRIAIAEELGIDRREVELMEPLALGAERSTNMPIEDDGGVELQDLLPDDRPDPEEIVIAEFDEAARKTWLRAALDTLPDRERTIIQERYLLDEGRTLKSLGEQLGVSKERVRQLESAALKRIQTILEEQIAAQQT